MKKALILILFCVAMISFAFPRDIFEIAQDGTPEEIKVAIEAGADVNARNENGSTPLHSAAYNPNPAVITTLIKAGADVNARGTLDAQGTLDARGTLDSTAPRSTPQQNTTPIQP